jgi:hypothetical protein
VKFAQLVLISKAFELLAKPGTLLEPRIWFASLLPGLQFVRLKCFALTLDLLSAVNSKLDSAGHVVQSAEQFVSNLGVFVLTLLDLALYSMGETSPKQRCYTVSLPLAFDSRWWSHETASPVYL